MASDLEEENRILRRQLLAFVHQARENESKLQRFNEQELALISATAIPELVDLILQRYPQTFHLDSISLLLIDPAHELRRILEDAGIRPQGTLGLLIQTEAFALQGIIPSPPEPYLGGYSGRLHGHLFPTHSEPLQSCALLPLVRHGQLIGSLNMASFNPARFTEESGTNFLERMAAIVTICLENCTNRHRLEHLGLTDPLTRINNRRYFDQRLQEESAAAQRNELPLACIFIDVDHFKRINDTLGHQTGDQVLRELALLIKSRLRQSDVLSRYGGEEFVALLPNTREAECTEIAERMRRSIEMHHFNTGDNNTLRLTISIGMSCLDTTKTNSGTMEPAKALLAAADRAVYRAKQGGRNLVVTESLSLASAG